MLENFSSPIQTLFSCRGCRASHPLGKHCTRKSQDSPDTPFLLVSFQFWSSYFVLRCVCLATSKLLMTSPSGWIAPLLTDRGVQCSELWFSLPHDKCLKSLFYLFLAMYCAHVSTRAHACVEMSSRLIFSFNEKAVNGGGKWARRNPETETRCVDHLHEGALPEPS